MTTTKTTTTTATTAQSCAERALQNALASHQNGEDSEAFTSLDLLRALRRNTELMYETESTREQLSADPFEHWREDEGLKRKMDRLGQSLQVIEVHRKTTLSGYAYIDAVVEIPMLKKNNTKGKNGTKFSNGDQKNDGDQKNEQSGASPIHLSFRYERQAEHPKSDKATPIEPGQDSPTVWYSIDVSRGDGVKPKERLLWVQVWADGNRPTAHLKAENLEGDDDEDGWEDTDDDDDEEVKAQESKRPRREETVKGDTEKQRDSSNNSKDKQSRDSETERSDRFVAGIDPDVLHQLLEWIDLKAGPSGMDEATAFFLLMTFPFYEHEWDIVGYILDSVFGSDEGDDDDGSDKE